MSQPESKKIIIDLQPLREAIISSQIDYKTVSSNCGVPFPKVLALMSGKPNSDKQRRPILYGNELVRLAFHFRVPLSELAKNGNDPRSTSDTATTEPEQRLR